MVRIFITDDQELIRKSLKIVLSAYPDIEVVGAVGGGAEVLETLPTSRPDVILMDIHMPKMDDILCTKAVRENYPSIKVITLTTSDDDDFIYNALKYDATGYMLKGTSVDDLYNAVVTASEGRAVINPDIATKVFRLLSQMAQSNFVIQVDDDLVHDISKTEWHIVRQIRFGSPGKEVAAKLYLSGGTMHDYLSNILSKLNLRDRV